VDHHHRRTDDTGAEMDLKRFFSRQARKAEVGVFHAVET
jgi:hypothetical protein